MIVVVEYEGITFANGKGARYIYRVESCQECGESWYATEYEDEDDCPHCHAFKDYDSMLNVGFELLHEAYE